MFRILSLYFCIAGLSFGTCLADEFIPRRQDKPPGPPLSPQAAIEKMAEEQADQQAQRARNELAEKAGDEFAVEHV